jgi:hypothetical protein
MFGKDRSKELRRFGYVKDGENYVKLYNGEMGSPIGPEVAIAYEISKTPEGKPDFDSVVMHKHGKPEYVEDWAKTSRQKMAEVWPGIHFEVIRGAIPVSELNGILDNCARLGIFLKQLHEAAEQEGALAAEAAARPQLDVQHRIASAFQISEGDVANVIGSNKLSPERLGATPEELAALLLPQLDMEAIENMALMGDDLDQQTDYAHDEIADQLRRMGVLESAELADSAGHRLADSAARIGYERERVRP